MQKGYTARLYPSKEQLNILNKAFGATRFVLDTPPGFSRGECQELLKKQRAEGNSIIKGTRKKKSIKNYCTPIK